MARHQRFPSFCSEVPDRVGTQAFPLADWLPPLVGCR
jgi:hypothetical protein